MITALFIPVDRRRLIDVMEIESSVDVVTYRQLVGEVAQICLDHPFANLYCSRHALSENLPLNVRATTLLWRHSAEFHHRFTLHGPVLLTGAAGGDGHDTDIAAEYLAHLVEASFNAL